MFNPICVCMCTDIHQYIVVYVNMYASSIQIYTIHLYIYHANHPAGASILTCMYCRYTNVPLYRVRSVWTKEDSFLSQLRSSGPWCAHTLFYHTHSLSWHAHVSTLSILRRVNNVFLDTCQHSLFWHTHSLSWHVSTLFILTHCRKNPPPPYRRVFYSLCSLIKSRV